MFSLDDTLKKSGSVGRWETKQFIGMALLRSNFIATYETLIELFLNTVSI